MPMSHTNKIMDNNDSLALFFDYRYLAKQIVQEYYNGKYDFDILMNYAIDGLMRAVNSIEGKDQLNNINFKSYATFYIKSEINSRINE